MAMEKQRDLAKELVKLCGLVRGSIVHTTRKCGRAQCECAKGKQHPFCYLSRSSAGSKNKIQYVKPSEEKAFERAVAMYERAWSIIEELSELNIKEIKKNGNDGRRTERPGGKKLLERKAEIVQALKTFNRSPSAKTFKEAENTPDRLLGQAMDDIVAEVLQKTVGDVRIERPAKKNSGTTGKG